MRRPSDRPLARGKARHYLLADGTPVASQRIPDAEGFILFSPIASVTFLTMSGGDEVQRQLREAPDRLPILRREHITNPIVAASGICPPERRARMDELNRQWREQVYAPTSDPKPYDEEATLQMRLQRRIGSSTPDE